MTHGTHHDRGVVKKAARRIGDDRARCIALLSLVCGCSAPRPVTIDPPPSSIPSIAPMPSAPPVVTRRDCFGACPGWDQLSLPWHEAAIASVAETVTGHVSASVDGTLRCWSDSWTPIAVFVPPPLSMVAAHPTRDEFAVFGEGKLSHLASETCLPARPDVPLTYDVVALHLMDTGMLLVASLDGSLHLYRDGKELGNLELTGRIIALAGDGHSRWYVAIVQNETTSLIAGEVDAEGNVLRSGATALIDAALTELHVDRASGQLVVIGQAMQLWPPPVPGQPWVPETAELPLWSGTAKAGRPPLSPLVLADGIAFIGPGGWGARWNPKTGDVEPWQTSLGKLSALHHGGDRSNILVGTRRGGVLTLRKGSVAQRGPELGDGVTALAFGPNTRLWAGTVNGEVLTLDPARPADPIRRALGSFEIQSIVTIANDDALVAAGTSLMRVHRHSSELAIESQLEVDAPALGLSRCSSGELFAAFADGSWSAIDLDPLVIGDRRPGHTDAVTGIAASTDCQRIATASEDGTIAVWTLSEPTPRNVFRTDPPRALQSVAWITADQLVSAEAFLGGDLLRRWSLEAGRELEPLGRSEYGVAHLAATSTHPPMLAWADMIGGAVLWSPEADEVVARFPSTAPMVMSVALSDDGQWLAMGSTGEEATLRIFRRRARASSD